MFLDRLEKLVRSFARAEGGPVTVNLRPATDDDGPLLSGMVQDLYRVDGIHSIPGDHITKTLARMETNPDEVAVFIIEVYGAGDSGDGLNPVGYAIVTGWWSNEYGGRTALLDELYILPEHRGKGYGPKVMDLIEEHCSKSGIPVMYLEVEGANTRARNLYESRGYIGSPRIHMYKAFKD